MTARSWVDPRVEKVTVKAARDYLIGHGWKLQHSVRPETLVFGGKVDDDNEPIVLVIPSSERMDDYRIRVIELIGALGILENRFAGDILTEMLSGSASNGSITPPTTTSTETVNK